jgi:hypothetical protein
LEQVLSGVRSAKIDTVEAGEDFLDSRLDLAAL